MRIHRLSQLRHRVGLRDQRGFTVLLALVVMTVAMMLVGAAYVAVSSDSGLTRNDLDQKRAYTAAQAGISQYIYQLNQNPNYWSTCGTGSGTVGATDAGSTETYSYKPLIATTAPANDQHCDTSNATATMIEGGSANGTFRISSTGTSNKVSRTIIAQFKQPSFLNYVYYTDYETLDPAALYDPSNPYLPGHTSEPTDCGVHYPNRGNDCVDIQFANADVINGPLHSEDTLMVCGAPTFGRAGYNDLFETPGLRAAGGCRNNVTRTPVLGPPLTPPATNSQILSIAQSGGYVYTGRTTIVLTGSTMSVTNNGTTTNGVPWPSNGVIYVSTGSSCSVVYTPFTANTAYTNDSTCGNVYVKGDYDLPLTIASQNDIIINGDITENNVVPPAAPTGGAELGLVANNFVRIYHQIAGTNPGSNAGSCNIANSSGPLTDLNIYAAILAVNHSFIVDNYNCGGPLGTLTVWGAIAQLYRGPVGTSGSPNTGYIKQYNYDDRLAVTEPPYFLSPASTAWYVSRESECDGTSC